MHSLFAHGVDNRNKNIVSIKTVHNFNSMVEVDQGCLITVQLYFEISA